MCTNVSQLYMAQQGSQTTNPQTAQQIQTGGAMQAGAYGIAALGDLAAGVMRARTMKAAARSEREAGQARARVVRAAGEDALSGARAAATGANVSVNSGSVLEAERQIVRRSEQDALVQILNADARAGQMEAGAGYELASGLSGFGNNMLMASDKWQRSRRAQQKTPEPARQADTIYIPDNLA